MVWIEQMLSQSHSTLELHQRVLADLDQREAAVVEKEAEARESARTSPRSLCRGAHEY